MDHEHIPERCPKCKDNRCSICHNPMTVGVMDFECSCPINMMDCPDCNILSGRMTNYRNCWWKCRQCGKQWAGVPLGGLL